MNISTEKNKVNMSYQLLFAVLIFAFQLDMPLFSMLCAVKVYTI